MPYETQVNFLARILRSGDSETVSNAIKNFEKLDMPDNYNQLIDRANIPFLIVCYSPENEDAQRFLHNHRTMKSVQLMHESPAILKEFYKGIKRESEEGTLPDNLFHLLGVMVIYCDTDYCRMGIRLLVELDFPLGDLEEMLPWLEDIRDSIPEADVLIEKIEWMQEEEYVDDEMDVFEEDEDAQDDEEDVAMLASEECGFEEGLEEKDEENDEEQDGNYFISTCEVYMKVLSTLIKTGDSEKITLGLQLISEIEFPLLSFHRYEITALIQEHAIHSEEANDLMKNIQRRESHVLADERLKTFEQIMEIVEDIPEITTPMMQILVDYMATEQLYHMDRIVKFFIEKDIPLEMFQEQGVKEYLIEFPVKNNGIVQLISKISQMEDSQ